MAGLLLGPALRYVDETSATVWVETDRPCNVQVGCTAGPSGEAATFRVAGHHYALVVVEGLTPGTETEYQVTLDEAPQEPDPRPAPPESTPPPPAPAPSTPPESALSITACEPVWPPPDSPFPPSVIRTLPAAPGAEATDRAGLPGGSEAAEPAGAADPAPTPLNVAFGSCRWAAPPPDEKDPIGPDALDTLAGRLAADPGAPRPELLVLLGDQIYADETSDETRAWIAERRDLSRAPGSQVANYAEYTRLYAESWGDPEIRWLLSTVPSCMIFDDHDVIDDWNTSDTWVREMRATPWWNERILSGLMSYWVYQHLGNLSPTDLAADPLYGAVRSAPDGTEALRAFAAEADADPLSTRWSYRRDLGRVRLLMIDSRAARVLDEQNRAMLDPEEGRWVREQVLEGRGSYDHLLVGTSLPWLLPHLIHDLEAWNAAMCRGERGTRWTGRGEYLRRRSDLEHWAAFPASFEGLAELLREAGSGPGAPATISVLSGDVHHAYVAEARWPQHLPRQKRAEGANAPAPAPTPAAPTTATTPTASTASTASTTQPTARVYQLTCSPVHNTVPRAIKLSFRFGWSKTGRALGRRFVRHGRLPAPSLDWKREGGPWFGNQLMTLTLRGRSSSLLLEQAVLDPANRATLTRIAQLQLGTGRSGRSQARSLTSPGTAP